MFSVNLSNSRFPLIILRQLCYFPSMATTEGNLEQFSYESYERVSYFAPCNGAHMATCPKTTSYGNEVFRSGCAPHPYMPPVGKKHQQVETTSWCLMFFTLKPGSLKINRSNGRSIQPITNMPITNEHHHAGLDRTTQDQG